MHKIYLNKITTLAHNVKYLNIRHLIQYIIFSFFLFSATYSTAQLSGTYSIGTIGNYPTIDSAISDLNVKGMSGAVVFEFMTGNHEAHTVIDSISGLNYSNTLTIRSQSGNAADVNLYNTGTSSENYIFKIDSSDYITFQNLTFTPGNTSYSRVFVLDNISTKISILNNIFNLGSLSTSSARAHIYVYNDHCDSLIISGNSFSGGYAAAYLDCAPTVPKAIQITNNTSTDVYKGIYLKDADAPLIQNNTFTGCTSTDIEILYCDNGMKVLQNKILSDSKSGNGIYLYYCDGTIGLPQLIANNIVQIGGTGSVKGIYTSNSKYVEVYHNSVHINSSSLSAVAGYFYNGNNIFVKNNIFANTNGGLAITVNNGTVLNTSDYNNYYSNGDYLGTFGSTSYSDLGAYQTASSVENNSFSYYPAFVSETDLHTSSTWLSNKGTPIANVTTDLENTVRSGTTPDPGAYEYTVTSSPPLNGTYTVGSGGNFSTINQAIDSLHFLGISGNVIFNILNGTYNQQAIISKISGASNNDTIIFQSQSGNKTDVTLEFAPTASADNYLFMFNGATHITFQNLTLNAIGITAFNTIFKFSGYNQYINLTNLTLSGPSNSSSVNGALIYSSKSSTEYLRMSNSTITKGYGFYFLGYSTTVLSKGFSFSKNTFTDNYTALNFQYLDAPYISENTISNPLSAGISLSNCDNGLSVRNNKISSISDIYGILLTNCDAVSTARGLLGNNTIDINSGGNSTGIRLSTCTYINVYSTTIRIESPNSSATAFYNTNGSNIQSKNNIFSNFGLGYAYYNTSATAITASDYNNYYSEGNYLAYFSNNFTNLSNLKAANSKDVNSLSVNPAFVSSTDLHSTSLWLNDKGTVITELTSDRDGDLRSGTTPDIGSDEFTTTSSKLIGTYTLGSGGYFPTFKSAVDSLEILGIGGNVIIDVITGSYVTQFELGEIAGASYKDTVIFQSQTGTTSDVTIEFGATSTSDNFIVKLKNTDYITFQKLTFNASGGSGYNQIVSLQGNTNKINLFFNAFTNFSNGNSTNVASIYNSGTYADSLNVYGNTFTKGGYAIYSIGISSSILSNNFNIQNNTFTDPGTAVYLKYHNTPIVNLNTISSAIYNGISLEYCDNSLEVQRNKITSTNDNYGIRLSYCDGISTKKGLIANNLISHGSTSASYGIYTYYATYQNIFNNSILNLSTNTSSSAIYVYYGSNNQLYNNVFASTGLGFAYYTNSTTSISASDYNDLFTNGTNLAYYPTANVTDLAAFQTASAKDANSISYSPGFLSNTDLHSKSFWLDNKGKVLPEVTIDYDGEARSGTTPDIGADEFTSSGIPLAGTYTIGSGGYFSSINQAIDSLKELGISAKVTFDILNGTYFEQMQLISVSGATSSDSIIFQAQSGNATDVTLDYGATSTSDNFITKISGADYISFKNLTFNPSGGTGYNRAILFEGDCRNIRIQNCVFNGGATSSSSNLILIYSNNAPTDSLIIENCTFKNGSYGINLNGASTDLNDGFVLSKNTFTNSYIGVYLQYFNQPVIVNNDFNDNSNISLYLSNCDNGILISSNKIMTDANTSTIYLYYCDGTSSSPAIVSNNFIRCGLGGSIYGIHTNFSNYINIAHNSVLIPTSQTGSSCLYANYGGNISIQNNSFANQGAGYAFYSNNGTNIKTSNYNNLFSTGTYLGYTNSVNYSNLNTFSSGTSFDMNSVSINPGHISNNDLHTKSSWLNGKGTPLTYVTTDIDGEVRDVANPDIGADEYSNPSVPLAGTYTIGAGGNFTTLTMAADSLNILGISDSVTFNILTGVYNEHITIAEFAGSSPTKPVTWQSQSGNADDVTIFYAATSGISDENFVIRLMSASNLVFKNLTFKSTGTSYSTIFTFSGNVSNLKINDNKFLGLLSSSSTNCIHITCYNAYLDSVYIENNIFTDNGYGIYLNNSAPFISTNLHIKNNTFNTQYFGIYLSSADSLFIESNTLNTSTKGMEVRYADNALFIRKNKISGTSLWSGISLSYCDASLLNYGQISNNFIQFSSSSSYHGIYMSNCTYQKVLNNSINAVGSSSTSRCIDIYNCSDINLYNNNFSNAASGYAFYMSGIMTALTASDNNNYYTNGTNLAHWGGTNITTLATLKSTSGLDVNAVNVDPLYETTSDLHASAIGIYEKGKVLTEITTDIDGEARDVSTPDIGADEISCTNPLIALKADTVCTSDSSLLINLSTNLRTWSTFEWDINNNGVTDYTTKDSIYHKFDSAAVYPIKLKITNPIGCLDSITSQVVVADPTADAGLSTSICFGNKVQLMASPGVSYSWSPSIGLSDTSLRNPVATPQVTTTYKVEIVESSGCVSKDSMTIFVKPNPVAYAGPDLIINYGDTVNLTATGGTKYSWDNGMTGATITLVPAFTRTYEVFVTKNGCGSKDEITIIVQNSPLPSFSFSHKLFGTLPGGPSGPTNCSTKSYLSLTSVNPLDSQKVYANCSSQVSTTYSGVPADRFRISMDNSELTYHENVDPLHQKKVFTNGHAWVQYDSTGNGDWKNVLEATNVSTVVEFICPDTLLGKMRGEISNNGDPNLIAEFTSSGNNQFVADFLTFNFDSTYLDSLGARLFTAYDYTFNLHPVENPVFVNGLGIVSLTDLMSFQNTGVSLNFNAFIASSDSSSATVIYYPHLPPHTTSQDTIATVFNNEFWEFGSTLDAFQVEVCFNYDSLALNTNDLQFLSLVYQEYVGGPWTIVSGTPQITGDKICIVTEHFSNWAIATTKPDPKMKSDTIFSNILAQTEFIKGSFGSSGVDVSLRMSAGQSDTVFFRHYPSNPGGDLPTDINKLGEDFWEVQTGNSESGLLEFDPEKIGITDSSGYYRVLFRPDAATDWVTVPTSRVKKGMKEAMKIRIDMIDTLGGHFVLGQASTALDIFSISIATDTVCANDSSHFFTTVTGGVAPYIYAWTGDDGLNTPSKDPAFIYTSGGGTYNYQLIVTDANQAVDTISGTIMVRNLPNVVAGNDIPLCMGDTTQLSAAGGNTYSWFPALGLSDTSVSNPMAYPTSSTSYYLTVVDVDACINMDTLMITVNSNPIVSLGQDTSICSGCSIVLDAGIPGSTYLWSTGANTQTITVDSSGYYYVDIVDPNGCKGVDTVFVDMTTDLPLSITTVQNGKLRIFPNPNNGNFTFELEQEGNYQIDVIVTDIVGNIIYDKMQQDLNGLYSGKVQIKGKPAGVYFIKIRISDIQKNGQYHEVTGRVLLTD